MPSLWALSRIKELQDQDPTDPFTGGSNQFHRRSKRIEKEVTDLGLRFSLLTSSTSFVAVEERKGDEKSRGRPGFRRIPVQLTKDWHGIGPQIAQGIRPQFRQARVMGAYAGDPVEGSTGYVPKWYTLSAPQQILAKSSKKPDKIAQKRTGKVPWYLKLLETQQAEGFFTGVGVVAERLKLTFDDLGKLAAALDVEDAAARRNILVTLLAVHLLSTDPDAKAVAGRAIRKATRWLQKQVAQFVSGAPLLPSADFSVVVTANGKPLREHLKERYMITI